jgi:hypothetical protein
MLKILRKHNNRLSVNMLQKIFKKLRHDGLIKNGPHNTSSTCTHIATSGCKWEGIQYNCMGTISARVDKTFHPSNRKSPDFVQRIHTQNQHKCRQIEDVISCYTLSWIFIIISCYTLSFFLKISKITFSQSQPLITLSITKSK